MNAMSPSTSPRGSWAVRALTAASLICAVAFALAACDIASASADTGQSFVAPTSSSTVTPGSSTATIEECVTAVSQAERSVTFSGEMTAVPGTVRMVMRVDVEERVPGEGEFHVVSAPGLGVWRTADAKVKVYKYLKQVSNLSAPAVYRGLVRFRWIGAKGHVIKRADRLTAKCTQPTTPTETNEAPSQSFSGTSETPSKG